MNRPGQLDARSMLQMLECLPYFAVVLDRRRRFVWVNRLDPTLAPEQVIGHGAEEFLHPSSVEISIEAIERAFETGEVVNYEIRGYADGVTESWYECMAIPLPPDEHGELRAMVLSIDATKRHVAEQALRASERRFRLLTETSPDVITIVDRNMRIIYLNREPRSEVAASREQMLGRSVADFMHPEFVARAEASIRKALETGERSSYEVLGINGRTYSCRALRLSDTDPNALVLATDITEQRQAEAQQARFEAQLQQAQKLESIGALAGGVAHDFNNILFVIQSHLEFARQALAAGDDPQVEFEAIDTAVGRAAELTRSLLTIGRRQPRTLEVFDLRELAERSTKLLQRIIPESIRVELRVEDQPMTVRADPNAIEQVLLNLCINARDAIEGTGTIELHLSRTQRGPAGEPGRWLKLSVRDTGRGMDQATLARAFEPFFTTKPLGKGSGLGLSMVHSLVTQNEGRIGLDSAPGEGTTVSVYLTEVDELGRALDEAPARVQPQIGGGETILVAEDDAAVRELVVRILRGAGYRVIEAEDGQRAVELFAEQPDAIDLVLLDAVMPALGGKDAYELIAKQRPDVAVLFASGYSADTLPQSFLDAHGLRVLSKPYRSDALLEAVRQALRSE